MNATVSGQPNFFTIISRLTANTEELFATMQAAFDKIDLGTTPTIVAGPILKFRIVGRDIEVVQQPVLVNDDLVGLIQFYSRHPVTDETHLVTHAHIDRFGNVKTEWSGLSISHDSLEDMAQFVARFVDKLVVPHES